MGSGGQSCCDLGSKWAGKGDTAGPGVTHTHSSTVIPSADKSSYSPNPTLLNTKKHAGSAHQQPAPEPKGKKSPNF